MSGTIESALLWNSFVTIEELRNERDALREVLLDIQPWLGELPRDIRRRYFAALERHP